MKARTLALLAVGVTAGAANAQAVTGFTGGSQFDIYYGGSTGDVVGWRFTLNDDVIVNGLGVWNGDTQLGLEGLTTSHMVGIWDLNTGSLLVSGLAGPGGTVVGQWTYATVADTILSATGNYVIGAMYAAGDGDGYVSSASSVSMAAGVNFGGGVFPTVGDLGFTMPGSWSGGASNGRFGPNFLFRAVPTPGTFAMLGIGGLVAARRRR